VALERWLEHRRPTLERIASRAAWLDDEDVARLLHLSLPGIDEIAAWFEILRFGRSGRYDVVVVDTAPTGHTLRMLSLPEALARLARLLDEMQQHHRALVAAIRGRWDPDAADALIAELGRDAVHLHMTLREPARSETIWVTLPEPMAVEETSDALVWLRRAGIPVTSVVVNRLTPAPPTPCPRCAARRWFESRAVEQLRDVAVGAALASVRARDREPRGVCALTALGAELAGRRPPREARLVRPPRWQADPVRRVGSVSERLVGATTRLLLFGGKGGVGKTTCAAAVALAAAPARRGRVLLLSTDPAHSLADVLATPLSDEPRRVAGGPANLLVRELDAGRRFQMLRARYAEAVGALFERISRRSAIDVRQERAVIADLLDAAPPGIDELVAVSEVTDALGVDGADAFDLVVMDMAPSGHALRLLHAPELVQAWARALMAILLKYQSIVGIGELGAMLLRLSQGLGRLGALLRDGARTRFVAVTRGAALPVHETARLVGELADMGIGVPLVVVNAVGRGPCARCRREAAAERRAIGSIPRLLGAPRPGIILAPADVPPPSGVRELRRWARRWQ
jgi:arsenite-transporting ATPase